MNGAVTLVEAVAALFRDKIAGGCEGALALEEVLRLIASSRPADKPEPRSLPALRYWEEGLALADRVAPRDFMAALREVAPALHWRQNPNYLKALDKDYLSSYGYTEFIGPLAPQAQDGLRVGVLLIGPGRHYPEHNHAAEEIYVPLTRASWWRKGEDWRAVAPGDVIHHVPWRVHATKTGEEPLIALYSLLGDVEQNAELTVA